MGGAWLGVGMMLGAVWGAWAPLILLGLGTVLAFLLLGLVVELGEARQRGRR